MSLVIDQDVLDFYKENAHLDFNAMNRVFIGILKMLSTNIMDTIDQYSIQKLVGVVDELKRDIVEMKTNHSQLILKMYDIKKEYLDDLRTALKTSENNSQQQIGATIEKTTDILLTKTSLLLNEVLPKNNSTIENLLKSIQATVKEDTHSIMQLYEKDDPANITKTLDDKISKMFSTIQTTLLETIKSSESRTSGNIHKMNENLLLQKSTSESLSSELMLFLNKCKTHSQAKGAVSQIQLYNLLQSVFPTDEVLKCGNESCDYRLNRLDRTKPTILFENKDYTSSVNSEEVAKFERDLALQKCHGILISQNSPITFKEAFHIDLLDNIIHLYIPNGNYDRAKIKLAVNIIDSLSEKLNVLNNVDGIKLSPSQLNEIKKEYCDFATKRFEMIDMIKSMTKQMSDKMTEKMEELKLPSLRKFSLGESEVTPTGTLCNICNRFYGKNKASLSAHMKACRLANESSAK